MAKKKTKSKVPGVLHVLLPDGSVLQTPYPDVPPFEVLRKVLGGWLVPVQIFYEGRVRVAYVDEEGRPKGLPPNPKATQLYCGRGWIGSGIVGNLIVFVADEPHGPGRRGPVSWMLSKERIKARLPHCADPDVHGPECVCLSYKKGGVTYGL